MGKINEFKGKYRIFSNYHICDILYEDILYPSTENAFQAAKCIDPEMRQLFVLLSPNESKKMGREIHLREDWEKVKFQVMEDVVRYKFTKHEDLKQKLLETGDSELIEGNDWKNGADTIWGISLKTGIGENNLGKILMKIRDELK